MNPRASLKRSLEKIRRLSDGKKYLPAFNEVDLLRQQWPDNVEVLVLWANLLQLQEEEEGPPLEAAKAALQRATELDEQNPLPWIELGYYLYAMDDDSRAAAKCFAKAANYAKRLLKDALVGGSKALEELNRKSEALACLAEALVLQYHNGQPRPAADADGKELLARLADFAATK